VEHPSVLVGNAGFRRLLWSRRGLPLPRLSPLLRGRSVRGAGQARDRANQRGRRQVTAGDRTGARRTRRPARLVAGSGQRCKSAQSSAEPIRGNCPLASRRGRPLSSKAELGKKNKTALWATSGLMHCGERPSSRDVRRSHFGRYRRLRFARGSSRTSLRSVDDRARSPSHA